MKLLLSNTNLLQEPSKQRLREAGYQIFEDPQAVALDEIDVLVDQGLMRQYHFDQFPKLKFLQLMSAGYDYLNLDQVRKQKTILCNGRDLYSIPIAEFVVARILEHLKNLSAIQEDQRHKHWEKRLELGELHGRRALVLGTGSIGHEIMVRLQAFGVSVDGVNSNGRPIPGFVSTYALETVHQNLATYDYVINALPLNENTRKYVSTPFIQAMKEGAVLVNIGRGQTMDESCLMDCASHLGALILDVFDAEPLPETSPLWTLENAMISSHTSFGSTENKKRAETLYTTNCLNFIQNRPLLNRIL